MFPAHFPEYNYIWIGSFVHIAILCIIIKLFPKVYTSEFGDAVRTLHEEYRIPSRTFFPMFFMSLITVSSGCSLGPEAPILVLGGSMATFIGEWIGLPHRTLRLFTLAGTYASLSAFFGSPISGIHALEFPHTVGMEFFEALPIGIASSYVSSTIFELLYGTPYGDKFTLTTDITAVYPVHIFICKALLFHLLLFVVVALITIPLYHHTVALAIGVFAAIVGIIMWGFITLMRRWVRFSKMKQKIPYVQPLIAWVVFSVAGMLLPAILFWGEPDLQNVIDRNATPLPRWLGGSSGIIDLGETYTLATVIMVGVGKIITLIVGVTHGLRGGVLFPLFAIGSSFGEAIHMITGLDQGLAVACTMSSVQGGITRAPLASSLVTFFLFNQFQATMLLPILCSTYCCYIITYKFPFFDTQKERDGMVTFNFFLRMICAHFFFVSFLLFSCQRYQDLHS